MVHPIDAPNWGFPASLETDLQVAPFFDGETVRNAFPPNGHA